MSKTRKLLEWGAVAVLPLCLACPPRQGGTTATTAPDAPPLPAEAPQVDLPKIPAKVVTEHIQPADNNDPSARSPVLDALVAESERWSAALAAARPYPAYYLAYQIQDGHRLTFEAEDGSLLRDEDNTQRLLDVEVRVGRPELDNRRPLRDDRLNFLSSLQRQARIPLGTDPEAIRSYVWLETDRRFREAVRQYRTVLTQQSVQADKKPMPPDFSPERPSTFVAKPAELTVDKEKWIQRARACSGRSTAGIATRSTCRVDFSTLTSYFVNSEGSQIQESHVQASFTVSVGVKADDGMPLSRVETIYTDSADGLPSEAEVDQMIARVNADLDGLHQAPIVDPYSGPAILQGRAAAVFFHEVFGHRIEGHRQKDETSGQTFSSKLGETIMPAWMSVYDDPTITSLNGIVLNGFYRFDDEGVSAQRAPLVTAGVLKGFVQGRNPLDGFPKSNGHGRHEPGLWAVSRQGNLVVEASRSVPDEELKAMLIAEVKRQGKPYGMMFTDISGGFTNTSRFLPQSFKVNPIMAYRVYPDGREELVRGVDIEGTPLIALGSIIAAGRSMQVFNGVCGAESGWVPVSASAPSLLLSQLEVARTTSGNDTSPTLPPPSVSQNRQPSRQQSRPIEERR